MVSIIRDKMKENRASKRFSTVIFALTACMILFAWVHSCFPADLSSMESNWVIELIWKFFRLFGAQEAPDEQLIRKLAHFSEYTAIGALMLSCAYSRDRARPHRFLGYVLGAGLFTAVCDETIQLFVEGRAGMIVDVWIDFGGVVTGTLIMLGFYAIVRRIKKRKVVKYGAKSSEAK